MRGATPRAVTTAAPLRHQAGGAGSWTSSHPRTTTLPLGSQQNASPFCDHLRCRVCACRIGTCRLGLITVWLPVRVLLYRGGLVSSAFRLLRRSGVGCRSQDPLLFGIGTLALP